MGIQDHLKQAISFFTRGNLKSPRLHVHQPDKNNLFLYCVVISGEYEGREVKGSSSGTNLVTTFLKALNEVGENIICDSLDLNCRSGIAGGLFRKNCIQRAKAELIERDAFLYHYRNIHPFKAKDEKEHFISFRLNSIDPSFKVSFVMHPSYLAEPDTCLIFGMGCDNSFNDSFQKAYAEYSAMYLNHKLFECKETEAPTRKADFHHAQSRSRENKLILTDLCEGTDIFEHREYDQNLWIVEDLASPLRYFQFIKVSHPQLEKMTFGAPEPSFQYATPVYHPFW